MKSLVTALLFIFCATNTFSQINNNLENEVDSMLIDSLSTEFSTDDLDFYGIPMTDLIDNFTANMEDLGFTYSEEQDSLLPDCVFMEGELEGEEAVVSIYFDLETGIVSYVQAVISNQDNGGKNLTLSDIEKIYDEKYPSFNKGKSKEDGSDVLIYLNYNGMIVLSDISKDTNIPILSIVFITKRATEMFSDNDE